MAGREHMVRLEDLLVTLEAYQRLELTLPWKCTQIRNEISVLKSISQGHKNIVTLWGASHSTVEAQDFELTHYVIQTTSRFVELDLRTPISFLHMY